MTIDKLSSAIAAIRAGDKVSGRKLLLEIIRSEPSNELAWLWLSACVDNLEHKKYCLEKALEINPNNQNALKALDKLKHTPQPSIEDIVPNPLVKLKESVERNELPKPDISQSNSVSSGSSSIYVPDITSQVKPAIPKKHKQTSTQWIVIGIIGGLLMLGVIIVGVIGVTVFLKPTPILVNNVSLPTSSPDSHTKTTVNENTSTKIVSTNIQKTAVFCQPLARDYSEKIHPFMIEFADTIKVAESTSRIALGPIIQDMQRIRRDIADVSVPSCVQGASSLIVNGMDNIVNAFIDFMGDVSDTLVQRKLNQGLLDLNNGTEQLIALVSGQATPVPKKLPTNTSIPTPFPTPTPLPAGSSFVIKDNDGNPWEIRVTKELVVDKLKPTFSDEVEKAAGRFLIVFMEVTNKGLSPETFMSYGTLDVNDASGQQFQENSIASFYAQDIYSSDICADINPDETKFCVSVYDISKQSNFYLLVPGILADHYGPRILLEVP